MQNMTRYLFDSPITKFV